MLIRILEPEVMDTPEEAADYDAMDHREVNAWFVADLLAFHGPALGGDWLDVGTGTALIPIELCRVEPKAKVLGIDLAEHMLDLARRNVEAAGLADRVRCERIDAKAAPFPDGSFEAVISNSIVHHIPEPIEVLAGMVRLVAPGGTLFVRDLSRPANLADLDHLVNTYAGDELAHARDMFRASLQAALTLEELQAAIESLGLPGEDASCTSDRHWTWAWRRPAATVAF